MPATPRTAAAGETRIARSAPPLTPPSPNSRGCGRLRSTRRLPRTVTPGTRARRVPPTAHRSSHLACRGTPAIELPAQPLERTPGLGRRHRTIDLRRQGDLAVPKDVHDDPGLHVKGMPAARQASLCGVPVQQAAPPPRSGAAYCRPRDGDAWPAVTGPPAVAGDPDTSRKKQETISCHRHSRWAQTGSKEHEQDELRREVQTLAGELRQERLDSSMFFG
jgi:hypothetical protein